MKFRIIVLIFVFLLSSLTAFAGGPDFDAVTVGTPTITCSGTVSITVTLDWFYAASANWFLSVDGTQINSGVVNQASAIDDFTFTGSITPKNDPSVLVELRIESFGGNGYDQTFGRTVSTRICSTPNIDSPQTPIVICDDGRLNPECDVVAIYAIEDSEGIHLQVWHVLPNEGDNGRFSFMLYQDELDALPDNPSSPILVISSEDGFVRLYWLPDNSYLIMAGPDAEGKTRVFTFSEIPGEIQSYTLELGD